MTAAGLTVILGSAEVEVLLWACAAATGPSRFPANPGLLTRGGEALAPQRNVGLAGMNREINPAVSKRGATRRPLVTARKAGLPAHIFPVGKICPCQESWNLTGVLGGAQARLIVALAHAATIEDDRDKLSDGQVCPRCGRTQQSFICRTPNRLRQAQVCAPEPQEPRP